MSILTVQHLEKHFENTKVLNDISFSLEEGQALSIIGSSGSGKTTLLRCLNFLETPDAGTITVQDKVLFDADHHANCSEKEIRKNRLHFGMVFQSFNLFPQYTALENVTLARELMAKDSGESKEAIRAAGMELLDQMGLADRAGHYPHQLSGGQQQRVAIARALALHPDILCFDEPTSALDPEPVSYTHLDVYKRQGQRVAAGLGHELLDLLGAGVGSLVSGDLDLVLDAGQSAQLGLDHNAVIVGILHDLLGDLDVLGKGLAGSVDHDGGEATVNAALAGLEVRAVVQMQNDGDIGAALHSGCLLYTSRGVLHAAVVPVHRRPVFQRLLGGCLLYTSSAAPLR